jgi:hypothetical protein
MVRLARYIILVFVITLCTYGCEKQSSKQLVGYP